MKNQSDITIELSHFYNISTSEDAGVISDRINHHVNIICCDFCRVESTIQGDSSINCGGVVLKFNGNLSVVASSFTLCSYSAGSNNKGGNVMYVKEIDLFLKMNSVYQCASSLQRPTCGDSPFYITISFEISMLTCPITMAWKKEELFALRPVIKT